MSSLYETIKDRPIRHVVMPGAHDAGMSYLSTQFLSVGIKANTQTQGLSTYKQLRYGSRWLDLRVLTVHEGGGHTFWTAHVNDETNSPPVGNSGESLHNVIENINQFTAESPGEIIFLRFSYLIGINKVPTKPQYWTAEIMQQFFDELKTINNRCISLPEIEFFLIKAGIFMDQNDGKGCVLILLDQANNQYLDTLDSEPDGIYETRVMLYYDHWADEDTVKQVAANQTEGWNDVQRPGSSNGTSQDALYINQWSVTPDPLDFITTSLSQYANMMNPTLF
ncbi:PI-PLC X-box domain-containing protein [Tolypocladium ophioglossoides CBS 100239]|uniref:PI-PLC X-box domain-containing protein n=1 Tax=Tolypocladium ophioglossoides (strain CBS 100239) TaxID=1163406 RepID=A0A0L0N9F7_TOLOC|nr:PI-PLC X-box domain-containing protein [Tolypocladium ophioglossoides CBS 100239]